MHNATLCLLIKGKPEKQLLLAMKKKGFGQGKWNGMGGKVEETESIPEAACREVFEEVGIKITPEQLEKAGALNFQFPKKSEFNQVVHVFVAREWKGEAKESEEMKPQWFKHGEIPYAAMWDADKHWMPLVLAGKKLKASFIFSDDNNTIAYKAINEVADI